MIHCIEFEVTSRQQSGTIQVPVVNQSLRRSGTERDMKVFHLAEE